MNSSSFSLFDFDKKNFTKVNTLLIAVNIIYFLVLEFTGSSLDIHHMIDFGALQRKYVLEYGQYYRLVTAMFMHYGIGHISGNMLILYLIGDNLERAIGSIKYLFFYLVTGVIANCATLFYDRPSSVSAGASGAVFAVMGALLYILILNKGRLEDLTAQRIGATLLISFYSGLRATNVGNIAHFNGALFGFVFAILLYRKARI